MPMMLIYEDKPHTISFISPLQQSGVEVTVQKAENMFLFHEQQAAQNHSI